MLDGPVPLSPSKVDICECHIILKINEALLRRRNGAHHADWTRLGRAPNCRDVLARAAWNKGLRLFYPVQRPACLLVQVNNRGEASRYSDKISSPALWCTGNTGHQPCHAVTATLGCFGNGAKINSNTSSLRMCGSGRRRLAGIQHGHNIGPSGNQCIGCIISIVIICRDDRTLPRHNTKTPNIGAHSL